MGSKVLNPLVNVFISELNYQHDIVSFWIDGWMDGYCRITKQI